MRFRGAHLAALSALVLAGCGSAPRSLVDLRRDATAICTRADRFLRRVADPVRPGQVRSFLATGIRGLSTELTQLRRLQVSGEAAPVYPAGLRALAHQLTDLRTAARTIRLGDDPVPAFRALEQRLAPLETEANNVWRALEIPACLE